MSVKMKVKVTKEILAKSVRDNGTECAIARSVRTVFPKAHIGKTVIFPFCNETEEKYWCETGRSYIDMPLDMQAFIKWFDGNTESEFTEEHEMEFEMEIPDHVLEMISLDEIRPLLENHPTLKLIEVCDENIC